MVSSAHARRPGSASTSAVPASHCRRVSSFLLTLKDPVGGPAWGYVFNDHGGKEYHWHALAPGGALAVDPVGTPEFSVAAGEGKKAVLAGESLYVRPALYTGDGLLIERAYRGAYGGGPFDTGCSGRIALVGAGGRVLERASTGFA